MNPFLLLGALDFFTMIKLIFAVVFGVVWLLNHLLSARQQGKAPPAANRPNARRPGVNPPADPAAPQRTRSQESLSSEIEQFLQEAAQRKRDKGQRGVPKSAPVRGSGPELPLDIEVLESPSGEGVSDSVKRHLDTREFAVRASNLTEDMQRADLERDLHMKETFDRKIGNLTDTSHTQPEIPVVNALDTQGNMAASIVGALLTKPESLRQAIVLHEVLTRPQDRWGRS
jgi:hypothetical protein